MSRERKSMDSVQFIGEVKSSLTDIRDCPLQESEGAPEAEILVGEPYLDAISGLKAGNKILVLTWLDRGDRSVLTTRPRNNPSAALKGVFATRSPDRPNPIGLHETKIISINSAGRIRVSALEVLDGTPVIDIKIALGD